MIPRVNRPARREWTARWIRRLVEGSRPAAAAAARTAVVSEIRRYETGGRERERGRRVTEERRTVGEREREREGKREKRSVTLCSKPPLVARRTERTPGRRVSRDQQGGKPADGAVESERPVSGRPSPSRPSVRGSLCDVTRARRDRARVGSRPRASRPPLVVEPRASEKQRLRRMPEDRRLRRSSVRHERKR